MKTKNKSCYMKNWMQKVKILVSVHLLLRVNCALYMDFMSGNL